MRQPSHPFVKYSLLFILLFFCNAAIGQNYRKLTARIDSFANAGLPKSALKIVEQLDGLAIKNRNAPMQVKAVIYRMTFQSYLEEDALVAIITRLKIAIDSAAYPVKPVLQSLLAQMYWNYYQENRYNYTSRSKLEKPGIDFRKWDLQTIINETGRLYDFSLSESQKEQNTQVSVLDGVLQGDKSIRPLRPTLYDLLVNRAFDFFLSDEAGINKPRLPFTLNDPRLFNDAWAFSNLSILTTDTASTAYKGIIYLQKVTRFHLKKQNQDALADLDLKRLDFVNGKSTLPNKDSLYLKALSQIVTDFAESPISATALLQIGKYYQEKDSLTIAFNYFQKAVKLHPNSTGGQNAAILMRQITQKELSATVEDLNIPGRPLLALLKYRNIKEARMEIYRISGYGAKRLIDTEHWTETTLSPTKKILKQLNVMQPVQVQQLFLTGTNDYKTHTAEFKINALPIGYYAILIKEPTSDKSKLKQLTGFIVTRLSYSARKNPDGAMELLITDRETGKPVQGASVTVRTEIEKRGKLHKLTIAAGQSNSVGKYTFNTKDYEFDILLAKGGDRYGDQSKNIYGASAVYNYQKPNINSVFFTDRQLYRPGQTIYFKGLHLSSLNGKSSILPQQEITVYFKDFSNKEISSLKLKTNDFGSVQGSFIIPATITSGWATIGSDFGSVSVRVEEYKRPTFHVLFDAVKQTYRLNDSVKLTGKVEAFSGYGISGATLASHITRRMKMRPMDDYRKLNPSSYRWQADEIKTDTLVTNAKGEFKISFKAIPSDGSTKDDRFDFTIAADATDAAGETQSGGASVTVGNNPLELEIQLPEEILPADKPVIAVKLVNINQQVQKGTISVKINLLQQPSLLFKTRLWDSPDQFILTKDSFIKDFPEYAWQNENFYANWLTGAKLIDTLLKINDGGSGDLDLFKKRNAGIYKVVLNAQDDRGDTVSTTRFVKVIAEQAPAPEMDSWVKPLFTRVKKGGHADFLVGINKPCSILMEKYDGPKLLSSEWLQLDGPLQQKISITVPFTEKNAFSVQFLMVNDNRVYHLYKQLKTVDTARRLNIRFLSFRDKLQPGEKETWKLQVTLPNNGQPDAEMLAALYDASLDQIASAQYWRTDFADSPDHPNYFEWMGNELAEKVETSAYTETYGDYELKELEYEQLNLFGYEYYGGENNGYQNYLDQVKAYHEALANDKKIAAKYVKNARLVKNGYDVSGKVITYGSKELPGVKIRIKNTGISTYSNSKGYFKIKVPLNGVLVFSYDLYPTKQIKTKAGNNLAVNLGVVTMMNNLRIADPGVKSLKGDAKPDLLYAAVGNADAKIDSTKLDSAKLDTSMFVHKARMLEMPAQKPQEVKPVTIRKNFNETAFFYPQLRTNEKGEVLVEFTMPDALTSWKFRSYAHTRNLETGYLESNIVTQKQLSINANMPRFLREGDTITVSARLANLTDKPITGRVKLQLFNALNMQPVLLEVDKADTSRQFTLAGNNTAPVSFQLLIPASLSALTYRLTAESELYSDGEENTLPVLPNSMLVTESLPMMVSAGQTKSFTLDKLVNQTSKTLKNKTLTLEYTQNPAWYAVQALPYMMEFPYECSEQVFNRYYANSFAANLVNKIPLIKQVFDRWKSSNSPELLSNLEKNQELKATLIEETPWLKDAGDESKQKKRIALLFDLNKMGNEQQLNLDKLQKKQLENGGFPWFGGDFADRYITQNVLAGIGQLYHLGIVDTQKEALKSIAGKALTYLDNTLTNEAIVQKKQKGYHERSLSPLEIHAWYVQSYFEDRPISNDMQPLLANYLQLAEKQWVSKSIFEQALIAITMQRYKKAIVAAAIIKSLKETAQQSDDLGMYWGKNQLGYYWYQSPVETQSLMIELFTEAGNNEKAVEEMKVWLLHNKQTSNWKTTKATAAACYALLLMGDNWLAAQATPAISFGGRDIAALKPDVTADAGTGYIKTSWTGDDIKTELGNVQIKNNTKTISWGALYWQYLENLDKITSANTNIHIERKYFVTKQTDAGAVLIAVDAEHQPKTGDLIKVVVYLKADRDFEYVQLKDMRPAGTEPVDALSTYKYQDGLYYYQVIRDVSTSFFISNLNKGNYVFEYQLRAAQPGGFSTGISQVQCMYAPEFNAQSSGGRMNIRP